MKNEFSRSTSIFFGPLEPINNAPDGNSGEPRHRIAHNLTREGLGDNMIGCASGWVRSSPGNEHDALARVGASDDPDDLIPCHLRQIVIEKNQVEVPRLVELDGGAGGGCCENRVAIAGEKFFERAADDRFVIDEPTATAQGR